MTPKTTILQPEDWRVLGHEIDPAGEPSAIGVPMRRLDLPVPYDKQGLYTLAHRLSGLSLQLQRLAESQEQPRLVVGDAMRQIAAARVSFADLRRAWDEEYRGLIAPEAAPAPNIEPFRIRNRTSN